jgi:hypothetical protein
MNPPEPDARRHPRFTVDVEATVIAGRGRRLTARTRDVSRTGICLITDESLSGSEPLQIELVLAFGDNAFSEPLNLGARVVWCTAIGGAYQVGAMFEDLTEQQDSYLDMFLQFLDGTLAPKGVAGGDDDVDVTPPDPDDTDDPFKN